ncbi:replication-associated recombination protein A [Lutispora thermophila]|uniref:Replication-associated recombination protein A n=1 Tax=Lutispora saccharofermentans TaxID=3024236 RepID=A0ABT1NIR6_9FIRM|nr:replication-associated recombination protein A [Lutispora saccharofermentans]MCQ1529771.1 replication-associated recombination protein A [Lutispora saccharofermentans]
MKKDQISIFDIKFKEDLKKEGPLAVRMRPESLDEFVGQRDIISPGKLLYRAIKADKLTSIILWGPTGSGKTTLARIISNTTKAYFEQINAVSSGIQEIKRAVDEAKSRRASNGQKTIMFIDEIHRFNKAQQDALLPFVEDGTLILIGATTENPYFEVNNALISRSIVFKLNPLSEEEIGEIIIRCLKDKEKGLGAFNASITDEALKLLAALSNGDARQALNALELAVISTEKNSQNEIILDKDIISECIQKKALNYDKTGDNHYDTISAFIKSMRGSDPDAAIHYLAKMIYAGEDPMFIARRIIICASEDVGNADPMAITVAVNAAEAVKMIGMPEGRIILAQAAIYVATAPKSNASYLAINKALEDVANKNTGLVPYHLRNAAFKDAEKHGYGIGYKYPHNFEQNYVEQQYMPDDLLGITYYSPSDNGYEKDIKKHLMNLKNK